MTIPWVQLMQGNDMHDGYNVVPSVLTVHMKTPPRLWDEDVCRCLDCYCFAVSPTFGSDCDLFSRAIDRLQHNVIRISSSVCRQIQ